MQETRYESSVKLISALFCAIEQNLNMFRLIFSKFFKILAACVKLL